MQYGKRTLELLEKPENSLDHWREQVKELGPDHVRKLLEPPLPNAAVWPISARQALEEYEKSQLEQEIAKAERREKREEERKDETLKLAREANRIARRSRKEMRYTWAATVIIGVLTIINMILLARGGGTF